MMDCKFLRLPRRAVQRFRHAYLASMPTAKKGLLILRVSDVKEALKILSNPPLGL